MKTRAKNSEKSAAEPTPKTNTTDPKARLGPESSNPPQLFILPEHADENARIISLANPRHSGKSRYLICPNAGFYEFTRIAAPKTTPRSWLLAPHRDDETPTLENEDLEDKESHAEDRDRGGTAGFVTKTASLMIATPVDALFLLLPVLSPLPISKSSEPTKRLFLSGEDYLDELVSSSPHLKSILRVDSVRGRLETRMAAVCDTVEAGDEIMYRLSIEKLLKELSQKARRMVENGLPSSMEEKLIRKALEAPMLSIKREDSSMHELADEEDESLKAPLELEGIQSSISSEGANSSFTEASTAATSFSDTSANSTTLLKLPTPILQINAPDDVVDLLRFRTALYFICSSYLAPHLSDSIKKMLVSDKTSTNFGPLDAHLAQLAKLRQDALTARSLSDYSRKRALDEDEESGETRAEKKRKKEEEEKRKKAGQSRGVRDLKKVNVSGMKKMTSFFTKKT
ncbi:hypothetical protein PVAG01_01505 [Phlyctema vagabunda]|uniref:Ribonuclease H2 subunit B n=1 Tax=Phlyctema vagabunda TaxID=108571 RepID=A0ABR4PXB0_9HELO